ncbi:hypothetical protein DPEC_G00215760 [Dallia pectoralis]|uniref:Uncharacterized protein n=1 Tax=Dallia pectoralis TaxID=75939 RepID=A0ACC2G2S8_DALPE|nr:hypothetical protein DPEC_G00215760 [Dallia pectoralis]
MEACVVRLHALRFVRELHARGDFTAQPVKVHFHELLGIRDSPELVPQVDNRDILCSVVSLFDSCHPDVGLRHIHDTVYSYGTHTIILLRQQAEVLEKYRSSTPPSSRARPSTSRITGVINEDRESKGQHVKVFSESEDSSGGSSDEQEEGDLGTNNSSGSKWKTFRTELNAFLARAKERRAQREAPGDNGQIPVTAVGAESLIVGAAAFQLNRLSTGETVLQLSLMATRKCYRNSGVGRYIVELLKSQSMCGPYDALLAHADTDAVEFFSRCGLADDVLLNDKFREVRDDWTNTTLMSYLPPFTTESASKNPGFSVMLPELELEVKKARCTALSAYQQQVVCVTRLVIEVKTLREQLELQRRDVDKLNDELDIERERRQRAEQQLLEYKLRKTRQLMERQVNSDSDESDQIDPESHSETVTSSPCFLNPWADGEAVGP